MKISVTGIVISIKRALSGDLYLIVIIVLVGTGSFGLGRLSAVESNRTPVRIEEATGDAVMKRGAESAAASAAAGQASQSGQYVASKNSDKYHLPWCSGAARIKEENKIWFPSKAAAERAGYTPAGNCKGI